jgi:hypothetical protein
MADSLTAEAPGPVCGRSDLFRAIVLIMKLHETVRINPHKTAVKVLDPIVFILTTPWLIRELRLHPLTSMDHARPRRRESDLRLIQEV